MKPNQPEIQENVTEVNLDGPEVGGMPEVTVNHTEDEIDLFNGEPIEDDEKAEKIAEAFGIELEEEKEEEVQPDSETKETETKETETPEEKETKEEEPKVEEKKEPAQIDWESDANPYKKNYADSTREVNEVLLPAKNERDALLAEKEDWGKERNEIRGILRSNPELLKAFLAQSEVYTPVEGADVPPVTKKPELDQKTIDEAVKKTIGEDGLRMIQDTKEKTERERMATITEFETKHPGLTREERGIIATQTSILEATLKLPLAEAMERSYKATFPERALEEERKKLEEEARVRAAKKENAKVVTTGASISTGSKPAAPQLTAKQLKMAKAFGLSPEDAVAE
jgi:hypothetical protein